jgi:Asp-tRNA(Asn)/Glu-tRNA(Gln) amidotransferase A subunit family amidase
MNEKSWRTAEELARAYRAGEYSPVDAVEAALERIAEVDADVNSMVTVNAKAARAQAEEATRRLRTGEELPPLFGIPVTVKDLTDTAGVRTTYGAVLHKDHVPDTDALAWARLKDAGVILIGKTTTPEYGMQGITDSLLTGPTSTPWRIGHNSGGSSGGAAAGVAAGIVPIAWGSDGGGSIRVPAALCGVVGIKPSVGRVPHDNNDDPDGTEGPIARTVLDAAEMLDATVGRHKRDRFSIPSTGERFSDSARGDGDLHGLRIAASANLGQGEIDPEVRNVFSDALEVLRSLGATVTMVDPDLPPVLDFFLAYWGPDFITFVDEMDDADQPVVPFIRWAADRARSLDPVAVSAAMRAAKTRIYNGFADVFENHDAIVTPTTPFSARPHPQVEEIVGESLERPELELHRLTEPPSHAGLPAITVPSGFSEGGLPLGLQIIAPLYEDARAIYIASRYERATPWHSHHPALAADDRLAPFASDSTQQSRGTA